MLDNGFQFPNEDCARAFAGCVNPTTDPRASFQDLGLILTNKSTGLSDSHQFQLTVDKRYSHGVSLRAAYTFAKTIDMSSGFRARSGGYTDPFNPRLDRGLADFDVRHRLVVSGSWELPLNRPFRNNWLMKKVAEGWQVNAIASFQAGQPFTLFSNNDNSMQSNFLDRPNLAGKIQTFDPRKQQTFSADCIGGSGTSSGNYYFDPTAFVCGFNNPDPVTGIFPFAPGSLASFGSLGRNTLIGPGINNWDLSFLKKIKFGESKTLEFRAEFFNAFNHAQFLTPDGNVNSGTFGFVTQANPARIMQLSLKLLF
jgi:hypothetical protein